MKYKKPNIFWIQIEGWTLTDTTVTQLKSSIDKLNRPYVSCSNMYCAAPSTMMSTLGMLSGSLPVKLATSHTSKRAQPNKKFDAYLNENQFITDILSKNGYLVDGFYAFNVSYDHFPYFKDRWQGLDEQTISEFAGAFRSWPAGSCISRLNRVAEWYKEKDVALFFHIFEPDFDGIIDALQNNELLDEDSIVIITADHGDPYGREDLDYYYRTITNSAREVLHDIYLPVENLWVPTFISAPRLPNQEFTQLCSGLDLAPTLVDLLGLEMGNVDGNSLLPYLRQNDIESPERYLRIDNRYQTQFKNRIITLITEKYRYHLRYSNSIELYPHYRHQTVKYPFLEEIYETHDIGNTRNLAIHSGYKELLESFRKKVLSSENEIASELHLKLSDNNDKRRLAVKTVLAYLKHLKPEVLKQTALYGEISDIKELCNYGDLDAGDLTVVSDKVRGRFIVPWSIEAQRAVVDEFICSELYRENDALAIYGAGVHTERLLKVIDPIKVSVIFDSNPVITELQGILVYHISKASECNFDVLLISSDSYELEMAATARKLIFDKPIVPLYTDYAISAKLQSEELFNVVEVKPIEWLQESSCTQVYSYSSVDSAQQFLVFAKEINCPVYDLCSEFEQSNYWAEAISESDKILKSRYNRKPSKFIVKQFTDDVILTSDLSGQLIDYNKFCDALRLLFIQKNDIKESFSLLTDLLLSSDFVNEVVVLDYTGDDSIDILGRFSGKVRLDSTNDQRINIYYNGVNNLSLQKNISSTTQSYEFCQVLKARHELIPINFIICYGFTSFLELHDWLSNIKDVLETGGIFIATVDKNILKDADIERLSAISGHELFSYDQQDDYRIIALSNAW